MNAVLALLGPSLVISGLARMEEAPEFVPPTAQEEAADEFLARVAEIGGLARPVSRGEDVWDLDFHVHGKAADDALLEHLSNWGSGVRRLHLGSTAVSDDGVARLAALDSLESLDLSGTAVTGQCLHELRALPTLKVLILVGCPLEADSIDALAEFPALQRLYLWRSGVPDDAILELALRRPEMTIDRGFDAAPFPFERVPSEEERQGALARIRELGGAVRTISQRGPEVEVDFHLGASPVQDSDLALLGAVSEIAELDLSGRPITDAGLEHLRFLTGLRKLSLQNTAVTSAGLQHLRHLRQLEVLNLFGNDIDDGGLEHLRELSSLRKLYVWQTAVSYDGAEELEHRIPGLRVDRGHDADGPPRWMRPTDEEIAAARLAIEEAGGVVRRLDQESEDVEVDFHLSGRGVTDEQLAHVAAIPGLVELNLAHCDALTDDGLQALSTLPALERLHLECTAIGDAGLAHLRWLRELRYLNLYGSAVTDAGLSSLTRLRNLQRLFVWQTAVTPAGVERLRERNPSLSVVFGWELGRASAAEVDGTCCEIAAAEGRPCDHECCVEARARGELCAKCNPR